MGEKQDRISEHLYFFFACIMIMPVFICGCSHFYEGFLAGPDFKEANNYFSQASYNASLSTYEQIIVKYPKVGDRVLFEMGIIYAYPQNLQKDYQKSLECFQKIIKDYPESEYRQDSEVMISLLNGVTNKDEMIVTQEKQIKVFEQEVKGKSNTIIEQQKKIAALEQEIKNKSLAIQCESADKILIEKQERRLTLFSKNKMIKTYKIALGGNPIGPKERQGDNKTPEGTYIIDSRNMNSKYHMSLHVSYPNEKDRRRAKELGVAPGSGIMIHGIKNGFWWVDRFHTWRDWTRGCIAVTDREIEEIDKLVPNGTIVEIKP